MKILDATAMCITMLSCALFRLSVRAAKKFEAMHTAGAEYLFNLSILNLLSIVMITHLFAGAGVLLRERITAGRSRRRNSLRFIFNRPKRSE